MDKMLDILIKMDVRMFLMCVIALVTFTCGFGLATSFAQHLEQNLDPGVIYPPRVTIHIGDSFKITCIMNRLVFPVCTVTNLTFIDVSNQRPVPRKDTSILNESAIAYIVHNAPEQQASYQCMCNDDAIGLVKVYVGTAPLPVVDFSCRSYDFEYMVCNFTQPPNTIATTYSLSSPLSSQYSTNPNCSHEENQPVVCNLTLEYRPYTEHYTFVLISENALGQHVQKFAVNNFDVMIPAAPGQKFRTEYLTNDTLQATWSMPKYVSYPKKRGLIWEVFLQPDGMLAKELFQPDMMSEMNRSTTRRVQFYRKEIHLRIEHLPYAFFWYTLRLRVRVGTMGAAWSDAFLYRFRTEAQIPDRPPRTIPGCFYVDSTETRVRLYWEQLQKVEQNGDNFTYTISGVHRNDQPIKLSPLLLEANSALFDWDKRSKYTFQIYSRNHVGKSQRASVISVEPMTLNNAVQQYSPHAIHNVYHATNGTYTLTWQAPPVASGLHNYTVYWCYSKRALQNECKDSIHFKQLDSGTRQFSTDPQSAEQEHTLNLAVSANYHHFNTGMHWSACTLDVNSDLVKMEPEILQTTSTSIRVQWSPESVCPSILEGYNLTYCEIFKPDINAHATSISSSCVPGKTHSIIEKSNAKKRELIGLRPFTWYKVEIFMYSRFKVGRSSEPLLVRTLEAAPTPPRQLQVVHVTNTTVTISWQPPSQTNGQLRNYTVILNNEKFQVHPDSADPHANVVYHFENLTAFTSYKAYVIAKTVESSDPSNDIHFTTLIGYPSMPGSAMQISDTLNDITIQWTKPVEPAGRIEYYEVAVTQLRNNETVKRRVSAIVGTTSCSLKEPACIDFQYKTTLEVRAVNAALLTFEVSDEIDSDSSDIPEIMDADIPFYADSGELVCVSSSRSGSQVLAEALLRYRNASVYRLYKSDWQHASTNRCSANRISRITSMALVAIVVSVCLMGLMYVVRNQYNKMSNINCTLPSGLDAYILKDNPPSGFITSDKDSGEISRNNEDDELVLEAEAQHSKFIFTNEKHHLLTAAGNDSGYLGDLGRTTLATVIDASSVLCMHSESSAAVSSSTDSLVESTTDSADMDGDADRTRLAITSQMLQLPTYSLSEADNGVGYIKPSRVIDWLPQQHQQQEIATSSTVVGSDMTLNTIVSTLKTPEDIGTDINVGYVHPTVAVPKPSIPVVAINSCETTLNLPSAIRNYNADGYTTFEQLSKPTADGGSSQLSHNNFEMTPDDQDTRSPINNSIYGYVTQRELTAYGQQQ